VEADPGGQATRLRSDLLLLKPAALEKFLGTGKSGWLILGVARGGKRLRCWTMVRDQGTQGGRLDVSPICLVKGLPGHQVQKITSSKDEGEALLRSPTSALDFRRATFLQKDGGVLSQNSWSTLETKRDTSLGNAKEALAFPPVKGKK